MMDAFSRLLVYSEIESLGIKGFLNQLLPKVGEQFSDIRFQGGFHFTPYLLTFRDNLIIPRYIESRIENIEKIARFFTRNSW